MYVYTSCYRFNAIGMKFTMSKRKLWYPTPLNKECSVHLLCSLAFRLTLFVCTCDLATYIIRPCHSILHVCQLSVYTTTTTASIYTDSNS